MRSGAYILMLLLPVRDLLYAQLYVPSHPCEHFFQLEVPPDSTIRLPHRWLVPGTLEISVDSVPLRKDEHYRLDGDKGEIRILPAVPHDGSDAAVYTGYGAKLSVRYRRLPVDLSGPFRHRESADTAERIPDMAVTGKAAVREPPPQVPEAETLQKSGSVFRGVSVGTDGMRLESGLRLQLSGQITPRVQVVASLTDQNTPIQPQGNTQTLQEIDKVVVQVRAPGLSADLGDFTYTRGNSAFGSYSKKWQGVMGKAESGAGSVTLLAASSRGRFTTHHFTGAEGNQGPYQLTGEEGGRDIIVLAGTERIWVDGELMKRGEDQDYTIEYGNGQVTFTRNRLITGDSRITADFEYSDLKFQKEIYGSQADLHALDGRLTLRASFLSESDNREDPLDFPLSEEMVRILESAGDSTDLAVTDGATYAPGSGSYHRADSADVAYYVFAGSGNGDYSVRFTYVGSGMGDYVLEGYGNYRYAGKGNGSYLPVIRLPMPRRHQVTTLESSLDLGKGLLLDAQIGLSDLDRNLFASSGDDDNTGLAWQSGLRFNDTLGIGGLSLGRLDLRGSLRSVGERFRPLGRMAEVEYGRKWGIREGKFWGERTGELAGSYRPLNFLRFDGEAGSYRGENGFRSGRIQFEADLEHPDYPQLRYSGLEITSLSGAGEGYWLRRNGGLKTRLGPLSPSVTYEGEHKRDVFPDSVKDGFRFDEWRAELAFQKNAWRAVFGEALRDDRRYTDNALESYSRARTEKAQIEWTWENRFSASFMFTHRKRDYDDPEIQDQRSDLADLKLQIMPGGRSVNGSLNYRFSSNRISGILRDTVRVERGYGNYRIDEERGELVPDEDGDILLRLIQSDNYIPVNELLWGGDVQVSGERLAGDRKGLWSVLKTATFRSILRLERRDRERGFFGVNRSALFPGWGEDSTVVLQSVSIQHLLDLAPLKWIACRVRVKRDDSENNQFLEEGILRRRTEQNIRTKLNPFTGTGFLVEWQRSAESRSFTERPWSDRNILQYLYLFEVSYRPHQRIEFALSTRLRFATDDVPDPATRAAAVFLEPRFRYAFLGRGQLRTELEWGRVTAEPGNRSLPYEMLEGDQAGNTIRWSMLLTYRLSANMMGTLTWRGRKEPWLDRVYQSGQMEIRAFF